MPTSLPGISLDETGKCNYCKSFEEKYINVSRETAENLQSRFEKILDKFRGKGLYDCLVPVSGGKDSMYVLYVLSKAYNLNVLAFNYNNGFQSPVAAKNIERALKSLGVEFIMYKPREDIMFDLYHTFLIRAGEFCTPCNILIEAASQRFARQNRIKLIILGSSKRWSASVYGMSISKYSNRPYYLNVLKGYVDIGKIENYVYEHPIINALRCVTRIGVTQRINLFDYFNPMKKQILETLEKELGWEPPSRKFEHGDCLLNPIKDYIVCKRWGFSEVTGAYSTQVRNGKMTREEAIKRAETEEVREPPAVLETFLEKIGLSYDDFEKSVENRHFTDFPNSYGAMFNLGKKLFNMIRFNG